ncbi:MAG: dipicolinate synthase subunit B [Ruminococcus sp.]|nr:dipicolinate synthase subunit B [Ruminococcus sp.]
MSLEGKRIGFVMTGSFCTFEKAFSAAERLVDLGAELTPVMSYNAASVSSRFGTAGINRSRIEDICGRQAILTIEDAEPIGPKRLFDMIAVVPCTSNTLAKLALGITDTPATMAVKSHIRNSRPVVIAISTNDALAAAAKNIGALQNYKNYYFVPYRQDNFAAKPNSAVAELSLLPETLKLALEGRQLEPVLLPPVYPE